MRTKQVFSLIGFSLLTAACSAAVGSSSLPGLQELTQDIGLTANQTSGVLEELADSVEAQESSLDIVQIDQVETGDLVIFAILRNPNQVSDTEDNEKLVRDSVEAIWEAAHELSLDITQISVAFMRVVVVNTFEQGPAPGGWLIGGVISSFEDTATFLLGSRTEEASLAYWESGAVSVVTLDQPYTGIPNHPLRSIEVQS